MSISYDANMQNVAVSPGSNNKTNTL